ncbi:MAG TPA: hypothetical protein DDW30_05885 [Clostridiales bacterium]|nr:hypothetical protein [Clostridiales bacterium]
MKLKIKESFRTQPDPYIFEDNGNFYLYVTGKYAVEMYRAKDPFGEWVYCGGTTEKSARSPLLHEKKHLHMRVLFCVVSQKDTKNQCSASR